MNAKGNYELYAEKSYLTHTNQGFILSNGPKVPYNLFLNS